MEATSPLVATSGAESFPDFSTVELRRNPYPAYAQLRSRQPVVRNPHNGLWMALTYDAVKQMLTDHETFSSAYGPTWMIFLDPPRHTVLRGLVSRAFTPATVASLEPRIREICRQLLDPLIPRGEMDLATDFSLRLPMLVIAHMMGMPAEDLPQLQRWIDVMLEMSYTIAGVGDAAATHAAFRATTTEMAEYLAKMLEQRAARPTDDLVSKLMAVEVGGQRLTPKEILAFFQPLLLAATETTTNVVNSAILCLTAHPEQFDRLRRNMDLLPSAIEEVLRYRSPLQWMYRLPRREITLHGQTIAAGTLVLAVMGSANRDPAQFPDPERFDIIRSPNAHLAFGHGIHFCLGAPLARLEARVALEELLSRAPNIRLASNDPWEPRRGLHVHGPTKLPIRISAS